MLSLGSGFRMMGRPGGSGGGGGGGGGGGWSLSNATYTGRSGSVQPGGVSRDIFGIDLREDGSEIWSMDDFAGIADFGFGTNYDISTLSEVATARYAISGSKAIRLKPDGTKMYFGINNNNAVREYNLSTPFDMTSWSFVQEIAPGNIATDQLEGFWIGNGGSSLYIIGSSGADKIYQYSLTNPWELSQVTSIRDLSVGTDTDNPTDVFFKPDGTKMYVVDHAGNNILEYTLSTAWDISTASLNHTLDVSSETGTSTEGITFGDSGKKMYVLKDSGAVYEYDTAA